ncbi:MAG: elongation factor P maturation arginine rhamnosyltransferase EarP [Treponema sp.]|nr:elongation factor P maturation arginine rhamnosyltransferase EarP [Treponema sp.]
MIITILCKVVDNFGDIGVTFRMATRLKKINPSNTINLIVDDLSAFKKICRSVDISQKLQDLNGIKVYDWNAYDFCYASFSNDKEKNISSADKTGVILECFQCGRPSWLEKILFEDEMNKTIQIIMIDYLTAEAYAEDFHCLKSLTRSSKVQKVNFMPGFTSKTGGLIIDEGWEKGVSYRKDGPVLIFTYDKNFDGIINAVKKSRFKEILLAQGKGCASFENAWKKNKKESFAELKILDYLDLYEWDEMLKKCSILFIRGEETMSRACLSGIPFVWHAYPQSDEYQLVKVQALLNRMKQFFSDEEFPVIENLMLAFNRNESDEILEKYTDDFLQKLESLRKGYENFAIDLRKNGDLCSNLMTFIEKITII